jgi:hypothetical protein
VTLIALSPGSTAIHGKPPLCRIEPIAFAPSFVAVNVRVSITRRS